MRRLLIMVLVLGCGTPAQAFEVLDAEALVAREEARTWPVVDVREVYERSRRAIPGSHSFRPELVLEGPVLIVGSDEETARETAAELESRMSGVRAYIVRGGVDTLRRVRPEILGAEAEDKLMPDNFNIPSDTCQPGEPLHNFEGEDRSPLEQQ